MSQIDKIPTLELSVRDVVADSMQFGSQIAERDDSSELESYTTYREQKYGVNSLDDTADWESDEDSTRPNACEPIAIPTRPKKIVRSSYSTAVKQRILRNWEGVITSVCDDYFEARLHDMTGKVDDEIVEIGFDEINEDEIDLVESGAVFYFTIFLNIKPSGTIQSASEIRFKRLIRLSESDYSEIKAEASSMFEFFSNE